MSALVDHITAKVTGRRYMPAPRPGLSALTQVDIKSYQPAPYMLGVRIQVSIGAEVRVESGADTTPHIQHMTRQIEQEVFGEFRVMLYELQHLLYNQDIDGAMRLTEEIHKQMFTA